MVEPRQLDEQQLANYRTTYGNCTLTRPSEVNRHEEAILDLVPHIEWQAQQCAAIRADLAAVTARTARADELGARQLDSISAERDRFWADLVEAKAELVRVRAELARLTDDPSADLPGTVRISPDGDYRATRANRDDGETGRNPWWVMEVFTGASWWQQDGIVAGWTRGTPVEGTPAAKAAHTETPTMCGAWHRGQPGAPAVCPLPAGHVDVNWPNPDRP